MDFCPRCNYSFIDFLKRGIEPTDCPHCHIDLRTHGLEEWQIECPHCYSDLVEQTRTAALQGEELHNCPFCFGVLKPKGKEGRDGCPACGGGFDDIVIEGSVRFKSMGKKNGELYVVFGTVPSNFEVNVKCAKCNAILNNEMERDCSILRNRLAGLFKLGDF